MAKRRTRGKARAKRAATVVTIRVGLRPGQEVQVLATAPIQRMAEEWTYLLRSRTRWADDINLRGRIRQRALDDLRRLAVQPEFFRALAGADHAEVELHDWDAKDADASALHEAAVRRSNRLAEPHQEQRRAFENEPVCEFGLRQSI